MDILSEKNLARWKIFRKWVCTCHCTVVFRTYLEVDAGYG